MRRDNLLSLGVVLVLILGARSASSAIVWPLAAGGNNHAYDLIFGDFTWTEARDDATTQTFNGQTGYLATITSQAENDFLIAAFAQPSPAGTSAAFGASDDAVDGEWRWVTGPETGTQFWQGGPAGSGGVPTGYANWSPIEPSPGEDYGGMLLSKFPGFAAGIHEPGQWGNANNIGTAANSVGYLVEFNAVPVPAALPLFLSGLAGLGLISWQRRRDAAVT